MSLLKRLTKPKVTITIALSNKEPFAPSKEVKGTITIEAKEDVDVNEIISQLVCIESKKKTKLEWDPVEGKIDETYWDEAVLVNIKRKVASVLKLTSGSKKEFPLRVKIPVVGRESFYGVDANLKWYVMARMDIKRRRNISGHKLIHVMKE